MSMYVWVEVFGRGLLPSSCGWFAFLAGGSGRRSSIFQRAIPTVVKTVSNICLWHRTDDTVIYKYGGGCRQTCRIFV